VNNIFIQIASYRDPQLVPTLKDCIEKSKHPKNLVFSITNQYHPDDEFNKELEEFRKDKRFKIIDVLFSETKGACWARNLLQQQYDNEKYTLQLDSHMRFKENWDEELILMLEELKNKGYKKPLLTGYVPSFDPNNDPDGRVNEPWEMVFDRYIPEGTIFTLPQVIPNWKNLTEPVLTRFYSAHFCFTDGIFVKEVPHDPNLYFHSEEMSIAVRSWTNGYDLFHTHKVIIWHEYSRSYRTKTWDDDKLWYLKNNSSHLRNRKLFSMDGETYNPEEFGIYGFGNVRTLHEYELFAGFYFKKRGVQQYTVDKKHPPNPYQNDEEWSKNMTHIFKHCIDIHYHQVPETDYDFWVVAFHDEKDETMYRKDADINEIKMVMNDPDKYCKIWREFNCFEKPKYWVVWPHSISKGWCERITGNL
jgi:glycosyltransferase involved in cell wall biosynthesis